MGIRAGYCNRLQSHKSERQSRSMGLPPSSSDTAGGAGGTVNLPNSGRAKTGGFPLALRGDARFGDLAPGDHRLGTKRVRIPAIVGICSTRSWARVPEHRGQPFHERGHVFRPTFSEGQGLGSRSSFLWRALIFRMLSPASSSRWALWTSLSRMASARVGSPISNWSMTERN